MIKIKVTNDMTKTTRKGYEEILPLLANVLTEEPKSVNRICQEASEETDVLKHSTVERYLDIIVTIQELFQDKQIHFKKQSVGGRTYKEAWIEKL